MGPRGCKYLTRGKWDSLASLDLGINRFDADSNWVKSKGCEELAKAVWNKMEGVYLCIYS